VAFKRNLISSPTLEYPEENSSAINAPVNLEHVTEINTFGSYVIVFNHVDGKTTEWRYDTPEIRKRVLESIITTCTKPIII